ncbi:hypothetical protein RKD41_000605 [Streptomyces tendae]
MNPTGVNADVGGKRLHAPVPPLAPLCAGAGLIAPVRPYNSLSARGRRLYNVVNVKQGLGARLTVTTPYPHRHTRVGPL